MDRIVDRFWTLAMACMLVVGVVGVVGVTGVAGCRRSGAPAGALKKKPGEKVGKIIFVGQKDACDCTANRVKETWNALQFALKKHKAVKVERISLDVERDRVKSLKKQRRFMVVPALYFFNPAGKLVAMLEGELKPGQISKSIE
jgi:hypothetical protein